MPSLSDDIQEYLQKLQLPDEERQVLQQRLQKVAGARVEDIHALLAKNNEAKGTAGILASVKHRLQLRWGAILVERKLLQEDRQGQALLRLAPPITRCKVLPEPWQTNPLIRFWQALCGRTRHRSPASESGDSGDKQAHWRKAAAWRRLVLVILMVGQTSVAIWYMKEILPYQGWALVDLNEVLQQGWSESLRQVLPYVLQTSILFLFAILFCWISTGFWTALMGFLQLLTGRDRYSISASEVNEHSEEIPPEARTALVMPIANEDVARVFAGLQATHESVAASGHLEHFDFFVLSDSNDPDKCVAEQQAWMALCNAVGGHGHIFYRRRRRRVKRKSGNIDDFCRRWGNQYRYMVVLDADSVMSGGCLTRLVRLMEAHPKAGIIQTAPRAMGMNTLYARMQQFATRVYGPLFTAGLHFWQLGESHYWGHNAIIRLSPFMEHCALAPLPGKGAFAGAILSHDFVEAALMRRAGWGVWIAYDLPGSYEELPPNLLDELKRDRRWCHGNLMNFRLFFVKGMHPVHRAVFLTGVMSYLSAPLWFFFLVLSTALLAVHKLMEPQYFLQPRQLFPIWPQWNPEQAVALFSTTLVLLFLPKLLSVLLIWAQGAQAFGGRCRLMLSMLLEMLFSVLLAPVRMIFHTVFVLAAFLGWSVQWRSPQRDSDATSWAEAMNRHGSQFFLGAIWTAIVAWLDPRFLWWLSPIVVSLMLAAPVSMMSSQTSYGLISRRWKLFLIPEEYDPPRELVATYQYLAANKDKVLQLGFVQAVVDPLVNALVCTMARARHAKPVAAAQSLRYQQVQQVLNAGPEGDHAHTQWQLLSDPWAMASLHRLVWSSARYGSWRLALEEHFSKGRASGQAESTIAMGTTPKPIS